MMYVGQNEGWVRGGGVEGGWGGVGDQSRLRNWDRR